MDLTRLIARPSSGLGLPQVRTRGNEWLPDSRYMYQSAADMRIHPSELEISDSEEHGAAAAYRADQQPQRGKLALLTECGACTLTELLADSQDVRITPTWHSGEYRENEHGPASAERRVRRRVGVGRSPAWARQSQTFDRNPGTYQ